MSQHHRYMAAANRLARLNQGRTGTNPSVACLLVDHQSATPSIISYGITAVGGRPHAEPIALERAGRKALGATAYVTLEPCAHHGTTPPCAEALIAAGVRSVVTAVIDPDDRVSGKGHKMLSQAGIETVKGIGSSQAKNAVEGYLSRKNRGLPFVTLKLAVTPNGTMGVRGLGVVPITGPISRNQVHLMRARHDAILVGTGTLRDDDPDLTCRLPGLSDRSPIRVVLDTHGTLKPEARIFRSAAKVPVLLAVRGSVDSHWRQEMGELGCDFLICDVNNGMIALSELMEDLALRGISSVMVEGGAYLAKNLLEAGLVNAVELFIGPRDMEHETGTVAVVSPITEGQLPKEFEEVGRWSFENTLHGGKDTQIRYERKI